MSGQSGRPIMLQLGPEITVRAPPPDRAANRHRPGWWDRTLGGVGGAGDAVFMLVRADFGDISRLPKLPTPNTQNVGVKRDRSG